MHSLNSLKSNVFNVNDQTFDYQALELFHYQFKNNKIYRDYVQYLGINPNKITSISQIPFLPIQFFKRHKITSGFFSPTHIFESSGTAGERSKHYIEDLTFYEKVSSQIFRSFFGELQEAVIIGLLPSYLERGNSSLVFMVNHFIEESKNIYSGFYLNNYNDLIETLDNLTNCDNPIFLFGVTFALLEFSKIFHQEIKNLKIIETGGMKGKGRELIREELHEKLSKSFKSHQIFSEYGMTELLSQAYLLKDGFFHTPPWMRVLIREIHDPFQYTENGQTGIINIIDLANVHSCAFIETEDLGMLHEDSFKVIGRLDNSDLRGCNLLVS